MARKRAPRRLSREFGGEKSGAAAGDKNIGNRLRAAIENGRLHRRAAFDPARIGILLVLRAHRPRNLTFDGGEGGERRPDPAFFRRLLDLLDDQVADRARPRLFEQTLGICRACAAESRRRARRGGTARFGVRRQAPSSTTSRKRFASALSSVGHREHVLIDKTLPRDGAAKIEHALIQLRQCFASSAVSAKSSA